MSVKGCRETFNVVVTPSILEEILSDLDSDDLLDFFYLNSDSLLEKRKEGVI